MSDILDEICNAKRAHIAKQMEEVPAAALNILANSASPPRGFADALKSRIAQGDYGLIAEIKRASPSKGLIREDFIPDVLAAAYEDGGATCLSVLTDTPYFQGENIYLKQARAACDLPVLRKDFMLDPYQVLESRAIGADCILLIMAALDDETAELLCDFAHDLGMDVLVETHDEAEIKRALEIDADLIGINNRNLKTLDVDIATTERLAPLVPEDRILISESGLYSKADLDRMAAAGALCFLVGESLMREHDVKAATQKLLTGKAA